MDAGDSLHPLCVVNFSRVAFVGFEYSDGFVVAPRNEFFTCGGVIYESNGSHVVHVNVDGLFQVAGIKCIQTAIEIN